MIDYIFGAVQKEMAWAREEGRREGLREAMKACALLHHKAMVKEDDLDVCSDGSDSTESFVDGEQQGTLDCFLSVRKLLDDRKNRGKG